MIFPFKTRTDATVSCGFCKEPLTEKQLLSGGYICPHCGGLLKMPPRVRIESIVDKNSFSELYSDLKSVDFLDFPGYSEKLEKARAATGNEDAVVCGRAEIDGYPCMIFVMDTRFIMASMGSVVGEKIARTFELAARRGLPVIGFTASGGARMQEGIISLMQMAKTSAAVKKHSERGLLYVTVVTNPTTGGVTASFAMQGDIILAEPNALVGFAGRRVVEQTTKQRLPDNFQSAEFLMEHGFIDNIVPRRDMKKMLSAILRLHNTEAGK